VHDTSWTAETVQLEPDDILVLYTDGITEAQNANDELFDVERLLAAAQGSREHTALAMKDAILAAVDRFVGDAAQFDDLTVMTLVRAPRS